MKPPPLTVTFYRVKQAKDKIEWLCKKAEDAFLEEKRLLIVTPSLEVAQYVDALLWRVPEESFIPHTITDMPTSAWVAITLQVTQNINQAHCLLNLCSTIPALYSQVKEIHEIYDETHPQKLESSKEKLQFYQMKGLHVIK